MLSVAANLTHAEAVYLLGIVEDLTQQAILLEDCWAGKVSEAKEAVITVDDESLSYGENYGEYLINAGKAGSIYKTYQEAAEEIIAGCVDIAGEVADLKMGNPYISSTADQRDYIESPYSCTSTIDFADVTLIAVLRRAIMRSRTISSSRMLSWTAKYVQRLTPLSQPSKPSKTLKTQLRVTPK